MSYRDPKQSLEGPIDKILEGIEEFNAAVEERFRSGEWPEDHITEIVMIGKELFAQKFDLLKVKKETW